MSFDSAATSFLADGGEMGARIRAFDWSKTALGPPATWPAPLRTAVRIMLTTRHPVFIFWGEPLVCFYNDAYSRSLGPEKHPAILGMPGREAWVEAWHLLEPQVEQVMCGRGATWNENHLVPIHRHGRLEEVYWTYSYGPIDDERATNGVGGVLVVCTETTAQVQAQQQVTAAESRWRALFDQAHGFVCILRGPQHQVEYANDRYRNLLGERDLLGRPLIDAVPEAGEQKFVELLDAVYRSGEAHVATGAPIHLLRSPGNGQPELRYLDFVYQPLFDADGAVTGIFVQGFDVTDRKNIEKELLESERRLHVGLESAHGGIFDWNVETGEVHWSDGHYRLLGLEPDARQPDFELWRNHVFPADLDRVLAAIGHSLETGVRYSEEYRVVHADGTVRWVHGQGLIVADPGKPKRMVGALIDIHERKEVEAALRKSEQRFRRMANEVPSLIWMSNARGEIEFINRRGCEFFGVTLEQLQSDGWRHLLHPDDLRRSRVEMLKASRNRLPFNLQVRMRHVSGEWRHVEPTGSPRITEGGRFLGYVGMCPDVTSVVHSQNVLRDADRRKDEFLATLSHELRNPLAPIRSAARILGAHNPDPKSRQWACEVIDRQVGNMAALLDDLFDISRITRGTLTISRQRVTLATIAEAAIEVARPAMEARRHHLVLRLPPWPIELDADPLRLAQAISNLLTNAAKYTDPGGVITLSADSDARSATIVVKDNGIGIAADSLSQIFTMFSQVQSALDRSQGGLGIGLALVRGIVELHGGSVEARSEGIGRGSEFSVVLPVQANIEVPMDEQAGAKSAGTKRVSRRIVVADDNRDGAESLALLLEMSGHTVAIAHGGREALERTRELRPDVVVLDIGMPDLTGYAVAQALRQEPWASEIKLVALTGWGGEADRGRAIAAGFDHHLTKPVDPDQLEALL